MKHKKLRVVSEEKKITSLYTLLTFLRSSISAYEYCKGTHEENIAYLQKEIGRHKDKYLEILDERNATEDIRKLQGHYSQGPLLSKHRLEDFYDEPTVKNLRAQLDILGIGNEKRLVSESIVQRGINSKDIYVCSKGGLAANILGQGTVGEMGAAFSGFFYWAKYMGSSQMDPIGNFTFDAFLLTMAASMACLSHLPAIEFYQKKLLFRSC